MPNVPSKTEDILRWLFDRGDVLLQLSSHVYSVLHVPCCYLFLCESVTQHNNTVKDTVTHLLHIYFVSQREIIQKDKNFWMLWIMYEGPQFSTLCHSYFVNYKDLNILWDPVFPKYIFLFNSSADMFIVKKRKCIKISGRIIWRA